MNKLVNIGPGAAHLPKAPIVDPVCIRMIGGLNNYNIGTDEMIDPSLPTFRIDVLSRAENVFEQRNIILSCERNVPPLGSKLGEALWLFEPDGMNKGGVDGLRAISMIVDRHELVTKLRALADEIETLRMTKYLCAKCYRPFEKPHNQVAAVGMEDLRTYKEGEFIPDVLCYVCDECFNKITLARPAAKPCE